MSTLSSTSSRKALNVARGRSVKVSAIFKTLAPKPKVTPKPVESKSTGQQRFGKSTGLPAPLINGKEFPIKLGFTKTNELFVGRAAMLGFASALLGELLTGQGILGQLGYELNVPTFEVDAFIAFLVLFNLVAAILPTSQTFEPEEQESLAKRPEGPLQNPKISLLEPKKFFGVTSFGFSKENEIFVGRVAQLGFASAIVGEVLTGKGPLAQFDIETGVSLADTEFGLLAFIAFFLLAAINEGTGKFVDDEEAY